MYSRFAFYHHFYHRGNDDDSDDDDDDDVYYVGPASWCSPVARPLPMAVTRHWRHRGHDVTAAVVFGPTSVDVDDTSWLVRSRDSAITQTNKQM